VRKLLEVAGGRLGRQTVVTLGIRVGALGLALVVAIVPARMLGTEGYGAYALAFAWVQILLIPGMLGMDSLMVRETARVRQSQPERLRAYARWSTRAVLTTSGATAVIIGSLVVALQASQRPEVVLTQTIALALLPLMAVTGTWQAVLRAIGRMYIGQVPEAIFIPVLILTGAGVIAGSSVELTPAWAISLRVAGIAVAVGVLGLVLYRALPAGPAERLPLPERRSLLRSSFALGLIGAVFLLVTRTDVVMLGILSDLDSVGSYTVAAGGASFVVFPYIGLNTVLAPTIAALYAAGNRQQLQRYSARRSCRQRPAVADRLLKTRLQGRIADGLPSGLHRPVVATTLRAERLLRGHELHSTELANRLAAASADTGGSAVGMAGARAS